MNPVEVGWPGVVLAVVVLLDGAFAGFRAAAGRNPLIRRRRYWTVALVRGAAAAGALAALVAVAATRLGDPDVTPVVVGRAAVAFGPFAALVVVALLVWRLGPFELGNMATVLVLGPGTLLRPIVGLVGGAWALAPAVTGGAGGTVVLGILAATQLLVGPVLRRRYHDGIVGTG